MLVVGFLACLGNELLPNAQVGLVDTRPDGPSWDDPGIRPVRVTAGGRLTVTSEILVGLGDWGDLGAVIQRIEARGGRVIGGVPRLKTLRVRLPTPVDEESELEAYERLAGIAYAEANSIYSFLDADVSAPDTDIPNDPLFSEQWDLLNTGQEGGKLGADINILQAWGIQSGSKSVTVAVVDSGIYDHPDIRQRVLAGYDFLDEDDDVASEDPHGLMVTGRIAANSNNSSVIAGVDKRCMILPVKVGSFNDLALFDIIQGIDFATNSSAEIINLSIGNAGDANISLITALKAARKAGKRIVAGSGNGGAGNADLSWPGASPDTISVGMTDRNDAVFTLSGTGSAVDFAAPGWLVLGLVPKPTYANMLGGTSFSSPQLAGVISLMLAENPFLTQTTIYKLLMAGAVDQAGPPGTDVPGWDPVYGHGRLSAFGALSALCSSSVKQCLLASPPTLSVQDGGVWVCNIDAGPEYSRDPYWLLGSVSGTEPGSNLWQVHFPLNVDNYLRYCLLYPNSGPLVANRGILDESGRARVLVTLPAGLLPAAGLTLNHAFAVFDGTHPHPFASAPKFVSEARAVRVGPAPQILFEDSFSSPTSLWSMSGPPGGLWHITVDGECDSEGSMLGYTLPDLGCDYSALGKVTSTAISPEFTLAGSWPYRLSFDQIRDVDDIGKQDVTTIRVVSLNGSVLSPPLGDLDLQVGEGGELVHVELEIPNGSKLVGQVVRLEVEINVKVNSPPGIGWMIDNIVISNDGDE